jgi:hypothetical protein
MGCGIQGGKLLLYTLQGLVGWDIEKSQEAFLMPTEEIFCGDVGPETEVCTAHDKTVMVWDIRLKKPTNCILAHSM